MNQEEANKLMSHFETKLDDLIGEHLAETDITTEQVNEYYGFRNDCQIAERLIETRELNEYLKTKIGS